MLKFVKQYGFTLIIIGGLGLLGTSINLFFNWQMLTNFFIVLRTVVKPLSFMWDFDTSFILIGHIINIFMAYYSFKVILLAKELFLDKNG